jgi:hypothetical protein
MDDFGFVIMKIIFNKEFTSMAMWGSRAKWMSWGLCRALVVAENEAMTKGILFRPAKKVFAQRTPQGERVLQYRHQRLVHLLVQRMGCGDRLPSGGR